MTSSYTRKTSTPKYYDQPFAWNWGNDLSASTIKSHFSAFPKFATWYETADSNQLKQIGTSDCITHIIHSFKVNRVRINNTRSRIARNARMIPKVPLSSPLSMTSPKQLKYILQCWSMKLYLYLWYTEVNTHVVYLTVIQIGNLCEWFWQIITSWFYYCKKNLIY